jgi:hypothetical protein
MYLDDLCLVACCVGGRSGAAEEETGLSNSVDLLGLAFNGVSC